MRTMMAELESWEAAAEFGIPEDEWANYQVRHRTDDLYVGSLASVFDAMRQMDTSEGETELASLAKTLLAYSHGAATKYLNGVEPRLNQLYASALYYLAGLPATATLVTRMVTTLENPIDEELFLRHFLSRDLDHGKDLEERLAKVIASGVGIDIDLLIAVLQERSKAGLENDPRLFIAAKLSLACIERFARVNVWRTLRENTEAFQLETWSPFLGTATGFPVWELLASQLAALKAGLLGNTNETVSLQMPTSAGKTALCELLTYYEVRVRGRHILFLVPFRALTAEISDSIAKRLAQVGINVAASHGGNIPSRSETASVETADVLITTPEKFTALALVIPALEERFQTVICDEGHLIDDDSRGLQYELLLTRLRALPDCKIVFISAVLPNVDEIHKWLGGLPDHLAHSTYRPVETDYAFLTPTPGKNNEWQLDVNPHLKRPRNYFLLKFLTKADFQYANAASGRRKLVGGWNSNLSLACAAALKARKGGSVALFTTTRGGHGIRGLAEKLIELCEYKTTASENAPKAKDDLGSLVNYTKFLFGDDYILSRLLPYSAGIHHGRLPQEVRREMEEGIQRGTITILLCTNTLAEGVNLPIRTLVAHSVRRYVEGAGWRFISNRTIKNIIGRAGRAGKETRGRLIFVNHAERTQIQEVLEDHGMEDAKGALYRLIAAINRFLKAHNIKLDNKLFDNQTDPVFLGLIDSIDFALLDLIPSDTPLDQIANHIDELLQRTLAIRYCTSEELKKCLNTVFTVRADKLQKSVPRDSWPLLKKSGASLRFWDFAMSSGILNHALWRDLVNPLNDQWLDHVVVHVLEFSDPSAAISMDVMRKAIVLWMSGRTYIEIAKQCSLELDEVLDIVCDQFGYKLQTHLSTLSQLASAQYGEDELAEVAQSWPSLLLYGLGSLQQLDLFELGASDRLAVWSASRFLHERGTVLRGIELVRYIRDNGKDCTEYLENDDRVPSISAARFVRELRM